jgi:chromosomal replication initiator protein
MYFLRNICKLSLMKVGEMLGGKDHTTVMHGVSKIEKELTTNPLTKQELLQIQKRLTGDL